MQAREGEYTAGPAVLPSLIDQIAVSERGRYEPIDTIDQRNRIREFNRLRPRANAIEEELDIHQYRLWKTGPDVNRRLPQRTESSCFRTSLTPAVDRVRRGNRRQVHDAAHRGGFGNDVSRLG